jgi:hypothetical protein
MRTHLLTTILGIALLAVASAANASTVPLSDTTPPPGTMVNPGDTGVISSTSVKGFFLNNYYFDLTGMANLSVDLTSAHALVGAALFEGTKFVRAGLPNFSVLSLAPGDYDFVVGGIAARSGASYSGTLSFTPVPLPAAAWLLLAGLAGVGALARRRLTV